MEINTASTPLPVNGEIGNGETGNGETGNGETGNGETGNGETGNGETGNGETGNGETGNGETGNGETGNGETGNGETGNGQTGNGEVSDTVTGGNETPSGGASDTCESCQQLRQELDGYKKEHAFYSDLKKKIALTDALIRRYSSKCQEFDLQQRKVEELTHKLASSKRDCKLLEEQLAKTLKEIIPWKREKTKFQEEYEDNKRKLMAAQDALMANQAGTQQYRIQFTEMEKTLTMHKKDAIEAKLKVKTLQAALDKRKYNIEDHRNEMALARKEKRNITTSLEKAKATIVRLRNHLIEQNISVPRIANKFLPKGTVAKEEEDDISDESMESVEDTPEADKPQDVDPPYVRKIQGILSRKEADGGSLPSTSKQGLQRKTQNEGISSSDDNVSGADMMAHVADEIDAQLNLTESDDDTGKKKSLKSAQAATLKQGNSVIGTSRLQTRNTIVANRAKEWMSPTRITGRNDKQQAKQAWPIKPVSKQSKEGPTGRKSLPDKQGCIRDKKVGLQRQLSKSGSDRVEKKPLLKQQKTLSSSNNDAPDDKGAKASVALRTRTQTQSQSGQSSTEKSVERKLTVPKKSSEKDLLDTTKTKPVRSISPRTRRQSEVGRSGTMLSKKTKQIKKEETSTESDSSDEDEEAGSRRSPPRTRSQSQSGQSGPEKTPTNKTKVLVKKRSKVSDTLSDTSDEDSPRTRNGSNRGQGKEKLPANKGRLQARKDKPKVSLSDTSDDDWQPSEREVSTYSKETRTSPTTKQRKIRLSGESGGQVGLDVTKDFKPSSTHIRPRQRRNTDTELEVKRYPKRSRRLPRRYENRASGGDFAVREFYSDGDKPLDVKHGRIFDPEDSSGKDVKKAKRLCDSSEDSEDEQSKYLEKSSSKNPPEKAAVGREKVTEGTGLVRDELVEEVPPVFEEAPPVRNPVESRKLMREGSRDDSKQAKEEGQSSREISGRNSLAKILTRSQASGSSDSNKAIPDQLHHSSTSGSTPNQEVKQSIKAENLMLSPVDSVFNKKFLKPISPVRSSPRKRHKSSSPGDGVSSGDVRSNPFFPEKVTRSSVQNLSAIFTSSRRGSSSSESSTADQVRSEANSISSMGMQTQGTSQVNSGAKRSNIKSSSGVRTRAQSQSSDHDDNDTKGDKKKGDKDTKGDKKKGDKDTTGDKKKGDKDATDVPHSPKQMQAITSGASKPVSPVPPRMTRSRTHSNSSTESKSESSASTSKPIRTTRTATEAEDNSMNNVKEEEVKFAEPITTRSFYSRRRTRSTSTTSSSSDVANQSDFLDQRSVQVKGECKASESSKCRTRSMSARGCEKTPTRITRSMSEPRKRDLTKIKNEFIGEPKIMAKTKSVPDPVPARRMTRLQAVNANPINQSRGTSNKMSDVSGREENARKESEQDDKVKRTCVKRTRSKSQSRDLNSDIGKVVKKLKCVDPGEAPASESGPSGVQQASRPTASGDNQETQAKERAEQAVQPIASVEAASSRDNAPPSVRNNAISLPGRRPLNSPILEPFQNYARLEERLSPLAELFEEQDAHRHMSPVSPLQEPFQNFDGERSLSPLPISPSETPPLMERPLSALSLPDIPPLPPLVTPLPPSPLRPGMTRSTSSTRMANQVRMVSPLITPPPVLPRAISPLPNPPMPDAISPIKENDNADGGQSSSRQSPQRLNLIPSPRNFHAVAPRHALAVPPHPTGHSFQAARCLTANFTDDRDVAGPSGINTLNENEEELSLPSSEVNDLVSEGDNSNLSGVMEENDVNDQKPFELDGSVEGKPVLSGPTDSIPDAAKCDNVQGVSENEQSKEMDIKEHEMRKDVSQTDAKTNDIKPGTGSTEDQTRMVPGNNDADDVESAEVDSKKAVEDNSDIAKDASKKNKQPCDIGEESREEDTHSNKDDGADTVKVIKEDKLGDEKGKRKRGRPRKAGKTKKDTSKEATVVKGSKPNSGACDHSVDDADTKPMMTRRRGQSKSDPNPDGDTKESKSKNIGANQNRQTRSTKRASSNEKHPSRQETNPDYIKLGKSDQDNRSSEVTEGVKKDAKRKTGQKSTTVKEQQGLGKSEKKSANPVTPKTSQTKRNKDETIKKTAENDKPEPGVVADSDNIKRFHNAEQKAADVQSKSLSENDHSVEKPSHKSSKSSVLHKVTSKPSSNLLATSRRTIIVIPATEMRVSGFKRSASLSQHKRRLTDQDKVKTGDSTAQHKPDTVESTTSRSPTPPSGSSAISVKASAQTSSAVSPVSPTLPSVPYVPFVKASAQTSPVSPTPPSVSYASFVKSSAQTSSTVSPVSPTPPSVPCAPFVKSSAQTSTVSPPLANRTQCSEESTSGHKPETSVKGSAQISPAVSSVSPTLASRALCIKDSTSGHEPDTGYPTSEAQIAGDPCNITTQVTKHTAQDKAQVSSNSSVGNTQGSTEALSTGPEQSSLTPTEPSDGIKSSVQNVPVPIPKTTRKIGSLWGDIAKKQTQSEQEMIKENEEMLRTLKEGKTYRQTARAGSVWGQIAAGKGDTHTNSPARQRKSTEGGRAKGGMSPLQKGDVASVWGDMTSTGEEQQEICRRRRKIPAADRMAAKQQKILESDTPSTSFRAPQPAHAQDSNEAHIQESLKLIATYRMGTNVAKLVRRVVYNFQFNSLDLMPVLYARLAAGNTSTQPVMTPMEERIVNAVMDWTKKNDCMTLVDTLLSCLRQAMEAPNLVAFAKKGGNKRRFAVCSTVCRIYTILCVQTNNLQCARVLAYDLLCNTYPDWERLLMVVAATWPTVLCKQESVQVSPVGSVIEAVVMQRLAKMAAADEAQKTQSALCSICGWTANKEDTIPNITQQLVAMIQDANTALLIDENDPNPTLDQMAYELIKATELLASSMGWEWTNNTLIREHLWPILKKWSVGLRSDNSIKNGSACVVMKIIAHVGILGFANNKQSVGEVMKMLLAVLQQPSNIIPRCVQLYTADAILKLSAAKPSQSCPVLQKWCSNVSQTIPISLSERIQVLADWVSNKDARQHGSKK